MILVKWPQTGLARLVWMAAGYAAAMALLALSPTLRAGVAAAFLVGAASIAFLTTGNSTIQLTAPPQMRGGGAGYRPYGLPLLSVLPRSGRWQSG